MPYIKETRRKALKGWDHPRNVGELTWLLTVSIIEYVKYKGLSFETINAVRGVLVSTLHEFDRRVADPYEDTKITTHGDVYPEEFPPADVPLRGSEN